jgi:WD40 repeat protein
VLGLTSCCWAQPEPHPGQLGPIPIRIALDEFGVTFWTPAWSPDGKVIALTHDLQTAIELFDGGTLKRTHILQGHKGGGLYSLATSPDSKVLASGGRSDKARFWDLVTGKELNLLDNNEDGVNHLAFTHDGKSLVIMDVRGSISVWDMEARKVTTKFQRWPPPLRMAISPDGKYLAWAGWWYPTGTLRLIELATGKETAAFTADKAYTMALAFAEDGKVVLAAGHDGNIRRWDAKTGEISAKPFKVPEHMWPVPAAFSPDCKTLAVGGGSKDKRLITLWDVSTGKLIREIKAAGDSHKYVIFSPDGTRLISGWDEAGLVSSPVKDGVERKEGKP